MEADGATRILLQFALLLLAAKLGGELARRLRQPAVAGEILAGLAVGPSLLDVIPAFQAGGDAAALLTFETLALLGVLVLLFQVGLECDLAGFRRVGASAGLVGVLGVAFSLLAGAGASWALGQTGDWHLPAGSKASPFLLHLFIGATLAATSVGITARVLRELGVLSSPESRIILAAAVLDDILGLLVLGVVSGLAAGGALGAGAVLRIVGLALGFVVLAVAVGTWVAPRLFDQLARHLRGEYILLGFAVLWMILVSAGSAAAGLAPIVGAFAAGVALAGSRHAHPIFEGLQPVGSLFVSLFFVLLGVRVDLGTLAESWAKVLAVAVLLTGLAVAAKLASGLGVVRGQASRLVVGVGMVPRGEVGLIFAVFGLGAGLIDQAQYAALVLVVLVTTLVTPPWLARLRGRMHASGPAEPGHVDLSHALDR